MGKHGEGTSHILNFYFLCYVSWPYLTGDYHIRPTKITDEDTLNYINIERLYGTLLIILQGKQMT